MSRLGDFLRAVYGQAAPFSTARAIVREWRDVALEHRESRKRSHLGKRKSEAEIAGATRADIRESEYQIWIGGAGLVRIDRLPKANEPSLRTWVGVANLDWWGCDDEGKVRSGRSAPWQAPSQGLPNGPRLPPAETHVLHDLLDRENMIRYLTALDLEFVADELIDGRECVRFRGRRRGGDDGIWPHWLCKSAEEFEFVGDVVRGLLVRITEFCEGQKVREREVLCAEFDQPSSASLFERPSKEPEVRTLLGAEHSAPFVVDYFERRLGKKEDLRGAGASALPLELREAAELLPFPLLAAPRNSWQRDLHVVVYKRKNTSPPRLEACIFYREEERSVMIRQGDAPLSETEHLEWEEVVHRERRLRISDSGNEEDEKAVLLELDGTFAMLATKLERGAILDLAVSLAAVSLAPVSEADF